MGADDKPHNEGCSPVAYVAIVPFLIHNTLGNVLEPKLMASGLELHPLTVVVSLTFWGSMWLQTANARKLHRWLDQPMGSGEPLAKEQQKAPSLRTSASRIIRTAVSSEGSPHVDGDDVQSAPSGLGQSQQLEPV